MRVFVSHGMTHTYITPHLTTTPLSHILHPTNWMGSRPTKCLAMKDIAVNRTTESTAKRHALQCGYKQTFDTSPSVDRNSNSLRILTEQFHQHNNT